MSASELKLQIINKITSIEDQLILEEILRLVQSEKELKAIYTLSDDEKKAVNEGLEDAREGKVHSSMVAENMIREWLKK
jgi:hypothetical protein